MKSVCNIIELFYLSNLFALYGLWTKHEILTNICMRLRHIQIQDTRKYH